MEYKFLVFVHSKQYRHRSKWFSNLKVPEAWHAKLLLKRKIVKSSSVCSARENHGFHIGADNSCRTYKAAKNNVLLNARRDILNFKNIFLCGAIVVVSLCSLSTWTYYTLFLTRINVMDILVGVVSNFDLKTVNQTLLQHSISRTLGTRATSSP